MSATTDKAKNAGVTPREMSKRSMAAIETKDRDGWLSLFAEDAVVEDPIGPSMLDPEGLGHRGKEAISALLRRRDRS